MNSAKKLTYAALLVALAFVGANLKFLGSIALDALPAFLGALLLGPFWGAAVGVLGHLLTALTSGFPFGLPAHLLIAAMMGLTMAAFWAVSTLLRNRLTQMVAQGIAAVVAVFINGPLEVLALFPLLGPALGKEALLALIPVISMASAVNVAAAILLYQVLTRSVKALDRKAA